MCSSSFIKYSSLLFGGFLGGSDSKEPACNAGDLGSIPGSGRSPGGGSGNWLQYSCLEKSIYMQPNALGYPPSPNVTI